VNPSSTYDTRFLLPPAAYASDHWWAEEQLALFGPRWVLVAALEQLGAPGDYVTTVIGRAPIVVIRGGDGALRAFQNLCRHRGMRLLDGSGCAGPTINCFYHQWRYELDGSLKVVPQRREQFPDLMAEEWGLLPASVDVWEGMVFVHPDPSAPPLASALGGVAGHLGSFRPGLLRQTSVVRIAAQCNWKLFVENHVDVYHLWYLHETTLGDFDHTRFEHSQLGPHWVSYEPLKAGHDGRAALMRGSRQIDHLAEADRIGVRAHLVFPNLMIATGAEFFATYMAEPVAPDRSVIELRIRAEADADPAKLLEAVQSFIIEDIAACEAVQAAVQSPAFAVGPLARQHEAPITAFHTHVLDAMSGSA